MKNVKKSVVLLGVTSALCVGATGYAVSLHQQLLESRQGVAELEKQLAQNQAELDEAKMKKYEEVAKQIQENKPKTVVGEVFENGYLKKHGDHYHFVYGKPPVDAIYENGQNTASDADEDGYVFNPQDIVEENELGYVVRHGDHYHFVYKNQTTQSAPMIAQRETTKPMQTSPANHNHHDHEADDYEFDPKDIVSENELGYVVRHGDHYHFIYKRQQDSPTAPAVAQQDNDHHDAAGHDHEQQGDSRGVGNGHHDDEQGHHEGNEHHYHEGDHHHHEEHAHEGHDHHDHEGDDFEFDPKDIVSENEFGYVVRHGDHYHFIYKKQYKPTEPDHHEHEGEDHDHDAHHEDHDHEGTHHHHHGDHEHEGEHHHDHEDDNFEFNPEDIVSEDAYGYVVRHGDHLHYIFKKDLPNVPMPEKPKPEVGKEQHQKCRLVRVPHGDHFHDVLDCSGGTEMPHFEDNPTTKPNESTHEHEHKPGESAAEGDNILPQKELTIHSPEVQPYLDYIVYAYGVERDTIRLQPIYNDNGEFAGNVFAFQNIEQGQDKSHIHPWIIPLKNFQLPNENPNVDAEIRFADELMLVAKRMGISTTTIRILGDRFEVPHGDHSHSLRIKNIDGIKPYLANKIKGIVPTYIPGELDEATVIQKINELMHKAEDKFAQQPVLQKRIFVALKEIQERLVEKGNSTAGYLKLLERFDKQYIDQQEVDTTEDQETQRLNTQHDAIIRMISELNLEGYGVTAAELRDMANRAIEQHNANELSNVQEYVSALRAANDRPGVEGMKYLYFFTQHLLDKELSAPLREQVANLITRMSTSTIIIGEEDDANPLFAPAYLAKKAIQEAHKMFNGTVDTTVGEQLRAVLTVEDEDSRSTYESMKDFANEVLDEDQKDNSLPVSVFREDVPRFVKPVSDNNAETEAEAEDEVTEESKVTAENEKAEAVPSTVENVK